MKNKNILAFAAVLILVLSLSACSQASAQDDTMAATSKAADTELSPQSDEIPTQAAQITGQIYLYGEQHSVKKILD